MDRLEHPDARFDRRDFLKLSCGIAAVALLGACSFGNSSSEQQSPTPAPISTETLPPIESPKVEQPKVEFGPTTSAWVYNFGNLPSGALPSKDWNFEEGNLVPSYNREAQTYTSRPENVRVENGHLVIEGRQESYNERSYTSARINTLGKFSFTYGTIEVDAKLPRGSGTWPAAWLLPADSKYNPEDLGIDDADTCRWATNGEIDFLEAIGRTPNQNIPATHTYNSLHNKKSRYTPAHIKDPYSKFHRYGITKSPGKIEFTLDGKTYATREQSSENPKDWPFEQSYYVIINLALGGGWGADSKHFPPDGIDTSKAPWQLQVRSLSYKPLG